MRMQKMIMRKATVYSMLFVMTVATMIVQVPEGKANPNTLTLTENTWNAPESGGSKTIGVLTNGAEWWVKGGNHWLTVKQSGSSSITFNLSPNQGVSREASVEIIAVFTGSPPTTASTNVHVKKTISAFFKVVQNGNDRTMVKVPAASIMQFPMGDGNTVTNVSMPDFWIGKTEVTGALWREVYDWAISNGYKFANKGVDSGQMFPIVDVTWRDVIIWTNAYSQKDGLQPVYQDTQGNVLKDATKDVEVSNPYMSQWLSLEEKEVIVVPTDTRSERR